MGSDRVLPVFRYEVEAVNGETSRFVDAVAAYVQVDDGFMTFKNADHEVVLMVNAAYVLTVTRSFAAVDEPQLSHGGGHVRLVDLT
jgi:hypothetical protein